MICALTMSRALDYEHDHQYPQASTCKGKNYHDHAVENIERNHVMHGWGLNFYW